MGLISSQPNSITSPPVSASTKPITIFFCLLNGKENQSQSCATSAKLLFHFITNLLFSNLYVDKLSNCWVKIVWTLLYMIVKQLTIVYSKSYNQKYFSEIIMFLLSYHPRFLHYKEFIQIHGFLSSFLELIRILFSITNLIQIKVKQHESNHNTAPGTGACCGHQSSRNEMTFPDKGMT